MKYKMLALILALTVVSWAQTDPQTAPSNPQQSSAPADKAKCACCDKMAAGDMKDMKSCTRHDMQAKDGKETASCCASKEAKSCCSGKDAKSCTSKGNDSTASCCKDSCGKDKMASACCGGKGGKKGYCSGMKEKTARACCQKEVRG